MMTKLKVPSQKELKKGDIIYRPAAPKEGAVVINGVLLRGRNIEGDLFERKYEVLCVGNCGRLWLKDLIQLYGNILGCIRFKDISTFDVFRSEEIPKYGTPAKYGDEIPCNL